jgi:Arc/MetJ-type ribon-helix-helix transcriptional regulator
MALNARLPEDLEQMLTAFCRKHRVSRSHVVKAALAVYLRAHASPKARNAAQLAEDLIPAQGIPEIQSDNVKALARAAFRVRPA